MGNWLSQVGLSNRRGEMQIEVGQGDLHAVMSQMNGIGNGGFFTAAINSAARRYDEFI
jgi:hypothetical protein